MKADLEIRIARPEEAGEISRVMREAFAPFENFYTPAAFAATTPDAAKIRARFDEEGAIWVALADGKAVGTVSVVHHGERLYIRSMAVSPVRQGGGIGRVFLETIENYAVQNGFEKLFLYTVPFLTGAIRLYERTGFTRGALQTEEFFGTAWFEMTRELRK